MSEEKIKELYADLYKIFEKYKDHLSNAQVCYSTITYAAGLILFIAPTRDVALKAIEDALECADCHCKDLKNEEQNG